MDSADVTNPHLLAAAHFIRSIAPVYGIPVILHSDHCAKKLLPWLDGMLDADGSCQQVYMRR